MSAPGELGIHPNLRGLGVSRTLAINELSATLAREGRRVFRLGLGQSPFPVPEPVVEALRANATKKDYLPVRGLDALREAVAGYHRRSGIACSPEGVMIAPGSKELMFLLALVCEGEIVIPTPAWVSYAPQAQIVGRRVSFVPGAAEDGYRLTAQSLEAFLAGDGRRSRLLILNYPSNPTGATYSASELERLAEVARRHRLVVLSDEIYGELHHAAGHVSLARFYPEGTILSSGLSKWCGAGGWRLGTFAFPPALRWLLDAIAVVASETYTSTSAPIQHAAVRAFQGGLELERYLTASRRILGALTRRCAARLRAMGAEVVEPQGAFYLFPEFASWAPSLARRGIATSEELCRRLLAEAGVATLPGSAFGRPAEELTLRIATVDFDGARALAALEGAGRDAPVDDDLLAACCAPVLGAMTALEDWLSAAAPLNREGQ